MRRTYLFFLFVPSVLVAYACGGSGSEIDGGSDATTSDGPNGNDSSTNDTGSQDATNDVVNNMDSGSDVVTVNITCTRPAQCIDGGVLDAAYPPDSGEVCCGTLVTVMNGQTCAISSVTTACDTPTACPTSFDMMGCGSDTVRLCSDNKECVEDSGVGPLNKCCLFGNDAGHIRFCANDTIAALGGGTCP